MPPTSQPIEAMRDFNRFYTRILGLLNHRLPDSDYTLAQARLLFELGEENEVVARDLAERLLLDPAQLSRMIKQLETKGLLQRRRCREDTRKQRIALTASGQTALDQLQQAANHQMKALLSHVLPSDQNRLISAMATIHRILDPSTGKTPAFTIRSHRSGDMGQIIRHHADYYTRTCGFDITFEAYVADGLARFATHYDADRDRLWVAEQEGRFAGAIAMVHTEDSKVVQLRWFIVDESAQGKGLGRKLLDEAIRFARSADYQKVILLTLENLDAARHIYARAGFARQNQTNHRIWGQEITEELWALVLK